MAETGDDCYFYYYSFCAKGDACPFRHQPAARGCEITCSQWEKGTCFKKACNYRHMVIEKDRSSIPCVWDSAPTGCMKPYCPFLHTKSKNNPTSQANMPNQSMPSIGAPVHPANIGRGGPGMRPPMYPNGPSRPGLPPRQPPPHPHMARPPLMPPRTMGYQGYMPHNQPAHPMMYQVHHNSQQHMAAMPYPGMVLPGVMMNRPLDNYVMNRKPLGRDDYDDSDDDYTSSDYSDVSISDDERKDRSRESSHRRVRSPRYSSSRREVRQRSDRDRKPEPRSPRESYSDRKSSRRKHDSDRDRSKKDSERNKSKPRKNSEQKDSGSEHKEDKKKADHSDEKSKSDSDEKKSDIKIKTLEEILREKALKNLHERTAQKKKAQLDAEKSNKEESDDSPEPILKSVVSVSKGESTSSQRVSENRESDTEVEFVCEKKAQSTKTIILDVIDHENEHDSSALKTQRQVKVKEEEGKSEQKTDNKDETEKTASKPAHDLSTVKVKTFEEIMAEKRKRREQENKDTSEETKDEKSGESKDEKSEANVIVNSKPTRKIIRVVKKEDSKKELKTNSKITVKRRVLTIAKKDSNSSTEQQSSDQEEKKKEKKVFEKIKPSNIFIKSFDEIMREKRLRKQEQTQELKTTLESTKITVATSTQITTESATATSTIQATKEPLPVNILSRKPTLVRNKHPRSFKPRKLKVIGRIGGSSSSTTSVSEPTSPNTSTNSQSPTSPTKLEPAPGSSNSAPQSPTQYTEHPKNDVCSPSHVDVNYDDDDDDDDDSWEHEELPAVPLETPTLEGPARIPEIPSDDMTHVNQSSSCISPNKRPRSSLEELFGVTTDDIDSKPTRDDSQSEDEKDVSPTKKVKTKEDSYHDDIVNAVNSEMSKKDDFDLDLDEEIANLPDKHYESFNEDDLLLELEEMINN